MPLNKFFLTSLTLLLISGCSILKPETVTVTKIIEKDINIVQRPKPVVLNDVTFYVVTEQNFADFKQRFKQINSDFVVIALSVKDYENLALNVSELKRYIEQQKNIIIYYEESIIKKE